MEHIGPAQLRRLEGNSDSSATVTARVLTARRIQKDRQQSCNADLDDAGVQRHCGLTGECVGISELLLRRFWSSMQAHHRFLKVARTIADIEGSERIAEAHISEALLFRQ